MTTSRDRTQAGRVVVVGGGLAAGTTVGSLRDGGFEGPVTLIAEEAHAPYERPPLSKDLLLGTGKAGDVFVHDEGWYAEHSVDLRTGTPVSAIDRDAKEVVVGEERVTYDHLVLATGSRPRRLAMADDSGAPVTYLRTLDDSRALKERLTDGARLGIIGGGWIGLEVAAAARSNGAEATLLEALEHPLERVLGAEVGGVFADLHRQHGVDLRTSARITGIERSGDGASVHLEDGTDVRCDLLVVGVGVEPVVELARAAGLAVDNGIRTDAHLVTSDPAVFAAGDVANADHPLLGRPVRVEHWDTALRHGKVVAANLLGANTAHEALPYFFTDQYDLGMEYVGSPGPDGFDRVVVRGDTDALDFTAWWLRGDAVVAGMHVNDWDAIADVRRLVGQSVDVGRLADDSVELPSVGE